MTGLLVAFEGPDGVGESTLARAVYDLLGSLREGVALPSAHACLKGLKGICGVVR